MEMFSSSDEELTIVKFFKKEICQKKLAFVEQVI
jgi:hypothetical protein